MLRKSFILLVVVFFGANLVFAQSSDEVTISAKDVTDFIKTYPQIKADFEKLGVMFDAENPNFILPEGINYLNKVNTVVGQYGYSDYADYVIKAGAILASYAAIKFKTESSTAQPEIQAAIDEIKNNPAYTAEQKEQMLMMLQQGSAALSQMSETMSNSENVAVVKPFVDQIEKLLEEE